MRVCVCERVCSHPCFCNEASREAFQQRGWPWPLQGSVQTGGIQAATVSARSGDGEIGGARELQGRRVEAWKPPPRPPHVHLTRWDGEDNNSSSRWALLTHRVDTDVGSVLFDSSLKPAKQVPWSRPPQQRSQSTEKLQDLPEAVDVQDWELDRQGAWASSLGPSTPCATTAMPLQTGGFGWTVTWSRPRTKRPVSTVSVNLGSSPGGAGSHSERKSKEIEVWRGGHSAGTQT